MLYNYATAMGRRAAVLWFKRWSTFDSARSLVDWLSWPFLALFGTSVSAMIAAAAAFTHWYWDAYGPIGVAFAFIASMVVLSLSALAAGGAALLTAKAKNAYSATRGPKSSETPSGDAQPQHALSITEAHVSGILEQMSELDGRLVEVSESLSGLARRSVGREDIQGIFGKIESERASRKADIENIGQSIKGLRGGISHIQTELQAFRERVQSIHHARRVLEAYDAVSEELRALGQRMVDPLSKPGQYSDWSKWQRDLAEFRSELRGFCIIVSPFRDITKDVFELPGEEYRDSNWSYDFGSMNDTQKHDYKTFRILYRNFGNACAEMGPKIRESASAIP